MVLALATTLAACGSDSGQPGDTEGPGAALLDGTFVAGPSPGFVHDSGFAGRYYFPETFGSGVALLDVDEDGALDLYAVQSGPIPGSADSGARTGPLPTNALLLGDGAGGWRDATPQAGDAAHAGYGMGVAVADVDGDARLDLFVTNVGPDALFLATGDADARFSEATPPDLVAPSLPTWSSSAGFADFDRDGHLDLVVLGYTDWQASDHVDCIGPAGIDYCDVKLYPGVRDHVYRGDGRGGFVDHSAAWGFGAEPGRGLGLVLADLDDDGFVDVYVANDTDANHYYHNLAGAGFEDRSLLSGASANSDGRFEAGMGVALADVSDDGLADIVVTNFTSEPNDLYVNLGRGLFRERSRPSGIAAASMPKLAFGVTFQDFDRDGREDLFSVCGHVQRNAEARTATWKWRQSDQLMMATGPSRFSEADPGELLAEPRVGRGLGAGDLDGDGAPDLVVCHSGDALLVALNRIEARGSWLGVRLHQPTGPSNSNSAAIGAKLMLELDDGRELVRWVRSGTGYLSQDDLGQHFGIPAGHEAVGLRVRWPDGIESRYPLDASEDSERWISITRR